MTDTDLVARLVDERDKAREEAGIYKRRMESYKQEMEIYLKRYMQLRDAPTV